MASAGVGINPYAPGNNVRLEPAVAMGAHPLLQATDWHGLDRQKEREEREARRRVLREARKPLYELPVDHMFEIPGRLGRPPAARPPAALCRVYCCATACRCGPDVM